MVAWLRVLWPRLLVGCGTVELLIDCVNDEEVTGPVVVVWLRVLWPTLVDDCVIADVVVSLLLVICLVPDLVEIVLWPILFVCDGPDEVSNLLVLGPCVEAEIGGEMVCGGTDR